MKDNTILPIIFTVALSIGIALLAYFLLIHYVVEVDLKENYRDLHVLDFYEQPHDQDIFITGSSHVNEGINAYLIEDFLQKRNINRSVYVLGLNAETPLSRVPELDNLVASNPRMVVICLSYGDLSNLVEMDVDRYSLISQRISCDEECRNLFNESQAKLIYQTPFERLIYERKFLIPSLTRLDKILFHKRRNLTRVDIFPNNFKDPWVHEINKTESEKSEMLKNARSYPVFEDLNPQKKALLFTVNKLGKNNISVIIVNMPLSPDYSKTINESTRKNFSDFINMTGVPWYDYEREYTSGYFTDLTHLNVAGRNDFSQDLAEIITNNIKKGE
jgi:hypothetical protein